ncbi:MAG: integrase [Actinomycetota bacterium]|nr:integrase [Actinomycetota bacterium]MDQ3921472.1 integrase [Actinomycetota bacterium]
MGTEEDMTIEERRKYLKKMLPLYLAADRATKGELLDQMERVTSMQRKSLIRLLKSQQLERKQPTTPRKRSYGMDVEKVVGVVWESLDYVCVERLKPSLLITARHLERFGELVLTPDLEQQLLRISESTLQRMTGRMRSPKLRLPRKGPYEANRLRAQVPMKRIEWETTEPGHFEVDTVHHAGETSLGDYIHTIQMVDVASQWSERVAVMGRGQAAMEGGFRHIVSRLPFPVVELHPDNGSEFFNDHLLRYFGSELTGLKLSRSKPFHKNDNPHVEQKNDTLVRAYFGRSRLDTHRQLVLMNEVYELMWTYYNLFQPVLKLSRKRFEEGKLHREWHEAKTPYHRLKETKVLEPEQVQRLDELYSSTNPRTLRQRIYELIPKLWEEGSGELGGDRAA